jgi:hypothetical protein
MKAGLLLALYLPLLSVDLVTAAKADQVASVPLCGPYQSQVRLLRERRGEFPVFWGRSGPGVTARLFTNPKTGTWTMLRVLQNSLACIEDNGSGAKQDVGL